jgi:succinate dehydrogenase iron-sulfur subunit
MTTDGMTLTLRIWRQARPDAPGRLVDYTLEHCSPDMSFLELLDVLNDRLTR